MAEWHSVGERSFPPNRNPFGNHFFGYITRNLTLPDGRAATYYGLDIPPCVHVVAIDPDETVYLIQQHRPNVMRIGETVVPVALELPGGFATPHKPHSESAQAELNQELSLRAEKLVHIGTLWPSVGVSNEQDHIFLGTDLSPIHVDGQLEETEQSLQIVTGNFGQIYDEMRRGNQPVSAQTLAALSLAATRL